MFILSVGAASVLALFAAAASTHKRSVDRTHAALLAERIFSEVQGRYEFGMPAKELRQDVELEVSEVWGNYTWELYLFHPGQTSRFARQEEGDEGAGEWTENELFARVIVRWKQKTQARSESFHSILLPRNTGDSDEGTSPSQRSSRRLGSSRF